MVVRARGDFNGRSTENIQILPRLCFAFYETTIVLSTQFRDHINTANASYIRRRMHHFESILLSRKAVLLSRPNPCASHQAAPERIFTPGLDLTGKMNKRRLSPWTR